VASESSPGNDVPHVINKLLLSALSLAALVPGVYFFSHHRTSGHVAKAAHPPSVPVVVGRSVARDVPVALNGIGTVQPLSVVEVKARVDGQLDEVEFTEGQEVHAGQLLALIDPRPFEAQLAQAQATRAKDQAQLNNARADVERYSSLLETGGVAVQTLEATKTQVQALDATVRADQAAIETAKLQLGFTRLVAPMDGRVGLRLIHPGALVHITDPTGIVTVTQMQPISVIFSRPQDELPDILASWSTGKPEVVAYSRDGSRSLATGELSVIDSQVDSTTGQIRLRATFANINRTLWPGSLVCVRLLVRTDHAVTVIPTRAVMRGQNGEYVYVVKADESVEMRPVTTGESVDGVTAVLSGLAPGETIVIDGQARIAPGARVKAQKEIGASAIGPGSAG
jgi:membrane fusion protein, multidrug efflux system